MSITAAALESTVRYLEHLVQKKLGVERVEVRRNASDEPAERFVDGRPRWIYGFSLDAPYRVLEPTAVRYVPKEGGMAPVQGVAFPNKKTPRTLTVALDASTVSTGGRLEIDFKWIVEQLRDWLTDHQHEAIAVPWRNSPSMSQISIVEKAIGRFGANGAFAGDLTIDQRDAIHQALTHPFVYVWGPPGTGKTKVVLAGAAATLVGQGKRVLVTAPTNLAVETALRAILEHADEFDLDERCILRLGVATDEFARDFSFACEDHTRGEEVRRRREELLQIAAGLAAIEALKTKRRELDDANRRLKEAQVELCALERAWQDLESTRDRLTRNLQEAKDRYARAQSAYSTAKIAMSSLPWWKSMFNTAAARQSREALDRARADLQERAQSVESVGAELSDCDRKRNVLRPHVAKAESVVAEVQTEVDRITPAMTAAEAAARGVGDEKELMARKSRIEGEIRYLEAPLNDKRILGMTLDTYLGRFGDRPPDVQHVLIDEAAYAPLVKTLPLVALGTPMLLLGDHEQLPPVCEAEADDVVPWSYWGQSVLNLERAFASPLEYSVLATDLELPGDHLRMAKLMRSFRFGPELARVLDEMVYDDSGLTGIAERPTKVEVVEVAARHAGRRTNLEEVAAVVSWLQANPLEEETTAAVLTPYKNQVRHLHGELKRAGFLERVEVMNTHRAQGREWDVVLFSAVDGSSYRGQDHGRSETPWFTNSRIRVGRQVLNTTLSRVKERLVLFVEQGYWRSRPRQLLGRLVRLALGYRDDSNNDGAERDAEPDLFSGEHFDEEPRILHEDADEELPF